MKIVIIGCGTIGTTLLRELSQEDHTITIIDEDKDKVEGLIERYDVFGVVGNGACVDIQREAGMRGGRLQKQDKSYLYPKATAERPSAVYKKNRYHSRECVRNQERKAVEQKQYLAGYESTLPQGRR